ncbi:unnamed protein product [Rhizoctonia solani]|uniref:F-box domain-containing protein n=1 Tax=Rhizoctonia solani TaxID=456999 RepID=A0A8H3HUC6_9AGAM|nr:unnamed protein product [Rhizoctonia solani]
MFGSLSESSSLAILEWEHAGAALGDALDKYLSLGHSLKTNAFNDGVSPNNLAARIDRAMESLYIVNHRIGQVRSALAQTRNEIMSPIYRLPAEVLSGIFAFVVFEPVDRGYPLPMSTHLIGIYRSLHCLLGVCSTWRNILLAAGHFWSVVPILDRDSSSLAFTFNNATELCLERAGDCDLRLAAIRGQEWITSQDMAENASRFRSVNISAESAVVIGATLQPFLEQAPSSNLSELYIHMERKELSQNDLPDDILYLFALDGRSRELFNGICNSLSILRVCGVPVHWDRVAFSDRLVELHLQEITLGRDASLLHFLNALSTATELRDLSFIAVQTFQDPTSDIPPRTDITFPRLQSLLLQDLYSNTLAIILGSISSRSHQLTLNLTEKCIEVVEPGDEPGEVDFDRLRNLLESVSVSKLSINAESEHIVLWLSGSELQMVMQSVPELEALKLNFWLFDTEYCNALRRPQNSSSSTQETAFSGLKILLITGGRIEDEEAFKGMISSHSSLLEQMDLNASIRKPEPDGSLDWETLDKDDELAVWIQRHVPNLQLWDLLEPVEFELPGWQLW